MYRLSQKVAVRIHQDYLKVVVLNSLKLTMDINFYNLVSGPLSYSGSIGKLLATEVWKLPVADFDTIPVSDFPVLPPEVMKDQSNDALLLYHLCIAIITGKFPLYGRNSTQIYHSYTQIDGKNPTPIRNLDFSPKI